MQGATLQKATDFHQRMAIATNLPHDDTQGASAWNKLSTGAQPSDLDIFHIY
jgi:hypothetical protein